jgi:hypothetical protein
VGVFVVAGSCAAQELGHKLVGTLGLEAGVQPPPGLYLAERLGWYGAHELFDRDGERVPGDFRLSVAGGTVGISFTYRLPRLATYVSVAVSAPVALLSASSNEVPEHLESLGLGDVYVQPLRLGWRLSHVDLVTGYGLYVPTASVEPDDGTSGVSRAQWSHQISFGGTVYFDKRRSFALSALGSFDINGRKIGIDVTRGATFQAQGGLGKTLGGIVTIGPVAYALWQVQDDRGSAVPAAGRGARDRAFGLGAELDVRVVELRGQVSIRYAHDFEVETRPEGQIVLFGITVRAWEPSQR